MQNKSNQVSAEQKSWWTKLHQDLFLMLINPIALILIVPKYIVQREDIWKELMQHHSCWNLLEKLSLFFSLQLLLQT